MTFKQKIGQLSEKMRSFFRNKKQQRVKEDRDEVREAEAEFIRNIDKGTKLSKEKTDNRFWKLSFVLMAAVLLQFLSNNRELADKVEVNIPQPVLNVTMDGERREWTHTTMNKSDTSREVITRRYIKEYIQAREGFVPTKAVMDEQWGVFSMVYWRTKKKDWARTSKLLKAKQKKVLKSGLIRSVQVSEPEPFSKGWWHVRVTFTHEYKNSTRKAPPPVEATIFLRGEYVNLEMPKKHRKHNEIGWVVDGKSYSVTVQKGEDTL